MMYEYCFYICFLFQFQYSFTLRLIFFFFSRRMVKLVKIIRNDAMTKQFTMFDDDEVLLFLLQTGKAYSTALDVSIILFLFPTLNMFPVVKESVYHLFLFFIQYPSPEWDTVTKEAKVCMMPIRLFDKILSECCYIKLRLKSLPPSSEKGDIVFVKLTRFRWHVKGVIYKTLREFKCK